MEVCSFTEMGAPGASHLGTGDRGPKTDRSRPRSVLVKRASLSLMRRRQLKSRKDALEAFQSPEKALLLVALLVEFAVIDPGLTPIRLGRNHGNHVELPYHLPRV